MKTITLKPSPLTIHFNTRSLPIPLNHSATQCQVHRLCVRLASWPGPHPPWPWPPRRLHQPPMAGRQAHSATKEAPPQKQKERLNAALLLLWEALQYVTPYIENTLYIILIVYSHSQWKDLFFFFTWRLAKVKFWYEVQKNKIKQCDFLKVTVYAKFTFAIDFWKSTVSLASMNSGHLDNGLPLLPPHL